MKTPQHLTELMNKRMDRQEFLKHLAVGTLLVFGGGAIANALGLSQRLGIDAPGKGGPAQYGYGASVYGGIKHS